MTVQFLERQGGVRLAYQRVAATRPGQPTLIFLGGFRSDMTGTKAGFLADFAQGRGQNYIRFDYSGHGQSGGRFQDGTIEIWRDDALAILDRLTDGPVILIGSSMGGWLALLIALARPGRVRALIGIAAAPDFTRDMIDHRFDDVMRESYAARGYAEVPNDHSPQPYLITRHLIESGNRVCLLNAVHALPIPVHLLQGQRDSEVDWRMPERIAAALSGADVKIHMVADGDHSLSRPQDLDLLAGCIAGVSDRLA